MVIDRKNLGSRGEIKSKMTDLRGKRLGFDDSGEDRIIIEPANISLNGISCKSGSFIPLFREVEISVILPQKHSSRRKKDPLRYSGVVVKCEKEKKGDRYDVHLYFIDITDKQRKQLREYLKVPVSA